MKKLIFLLGFCSLIYCVDFNQTLAVKDKSGLKELPHQRVQFEKITQGIGTGQTREEALNNALIDALSRLYGVSSVNLRQEVKNVDLNFSHLGVSSRSLQSTFQNVSKGRIDNYHIDKIEQNGTVWQIELSAYKYIYKSDIKPKLVLFDANNGKFGQSLSQALNNIFSNSDNFTLLKRNDNFKSEDELLKSGLASSEDSYKLGNVFGTDYILEYEILDISKDKNIQISHFNEKINFNISYKLIFYPTRELVFSKSLNTSSSFFDSMKKEQKVWENIALNIQEDIENSLFYGSLKENVKGREPIYKLHENGGVDLGF